MPEWGYGLVRGRTDGAAPDLGGVCPRRCSRCAAAQRCCAPHRRCPAAPPARSCRGHARRRSGLPRRAIGVARCSSRGAAPLWRGCASWRQRSGPTRPPQTQMRTPPRSSQQQGAPAATAAATHAAAAARACASVWMRVLKGLAVPAVPPPLQLPVGAGAGREGQPRAADGAAAKGRGADCGAECVGAGGAGGAASRTSLPLLLLLQPMPATRLRWPAAALACCPHPPAHPPRPPRCRAVPCSLHHVGLGRDEPHIRLWRGLGGVLVRH